MHSHHARQRHRRAAHAAGQGADPSGGVSLPGLCRLASGPYQPRWAPQAPPPLPRPTSRAEALQRFETKQGAEGLRASMCRRGVELVYYAWEQHHRQAARPGTGPEHPR